MSKKNKRGNNVVNLAQRANNIQLSPKTHNQRLYLQALREKEQVIGIGPAGTGKTFLPTLVACQMYMRGNIKKIVVSRPAVAAIGEEHGFLPGDLGRKLAPWVVPVVELIEECLGSKERVQTMMRSGDLEIVPFTYLRGRTLKDAFVILDEAQNTTPEQMELFLTRIGENTKVVVTGDLRQSDIGKKSGLKVAVDLIEKYQIPADIIRFTTEDVVRSGMCKFWVNAFEKEFPK